MYTKIRIKETVERIVRGDDAAVVGEGGIFFSRNGMRSVGRRMRYLKMRFSE
jgi:hypothetical protein